MCIRILLSSTRRTVFKAKALYICCIYILHTLTIQCCFVIYIADDTEVETFEIDFSAYENVSNAFVKLFTTCQKAIKVSSEEFRAIRSSCVARASEPLHGLLKRAPDTPCLFEILADNNKYCNWMNVSFLEVIAIACDNTHLQSLIGSYTDVIYSKPLSEVWGCVPHYSVRDKYYSELKAKFGDKDPDNMTVKELIKSKPQLAKKIAMLIALVEEGSLLITWLIPTDELYQAYLSFLTIPQQSRMDELVQFGNWMAYLPKDILQKYEEEINCGWLSFMNLHSSYFCTCTYVRTYNKLCIFTYVYVHTYVSTYVYM